MTPPSENAAGAAEDTDSDANSKSRRPTTRFTARRRSSSSPAEMLKRGQRPQAIQTWSRSSASRRSISAPSPHPTLSTLSSESCCARTLIPYQLGRRKRRPASNTALLTAGVIGSPVTDRVAPAAPPATLLDVLGWAWRELNRTFNNQTPTLAYKPNANKVLDNGDIEGDLVSDDADGDTLRVHRLPTPLTATSSYIPTGLSPTLLTPPTPATTRSTSRSATQATAFTFTAFRVLSTC